MARNPPDELKATLVKEIVRLVRKEANRLIISAASSGLPHDNGAKHLKELAEYWEAGFKGLIPDGFDPYLKQYKKTQDPDYSKYLELKKKFET